MKKNRDRDRDRKVEREEERKKEKHNKTKHKHAFAFTHNKYAAYTRLLFFLSCKHCTCTFTCSMVVFDVG